MDFFWPGVLGEPKAFLVFCNSILSLAKKEKRIRLKERKTTSKATVSKTNPVFYLSTRICQHLAQQQSEGTQKLNKAEQKNTQSQPWGLSPGPSVYMTDALPAELLAPCLALWPSKNMLSEACQKKQGKVFFVCCAWAYKCVCFLALMCVLLLRVCCWWSLFCCCCWFCGSMCVVGFVGCLFCWLVCLLFLGCVLVAFVGLCVCWFRFVFWFFVLAGFLGLLLVVCMFRCWWCCCSFCRAVCLLVSCVCCFGGLCVCCFCVFVGFGVCFAFVFAGFVGFLLAVDMLCCCCSSFRRAVCLLVLWVCCFGGLCVCCFCVFAGFGVCFAFVFVGFCVFVVFVCVCWLWCVFCFCVCWFCGFGVFVSCVLVVFVVCLLFFVCLLALVCILLLCLLVSGRCWFCRAVYLLVFWWVRCICELCVCCFCWVVGLLAWVWAFCFCVHSGAWGPLGYGPSTLAHQLQSTVPTVCSGGMASSTQCFFMLPPPQFLSFFAVHFMLSVPFCSCFLPSFLIPSSGIPTEKFSPFSTEAEWRSG